MSAYNLFTTFRAKPGNENDLADFFAGVQKGMQDFEGCKRYRTYRDAKNADLICVFESWIDEAAHKKSLTDPKVRESIGKGMPLIAGVVSQSVLTEV